MLSIFGIISIFILVVTLFDAGVYYFENKQQSPFQYLMLAITLFIYAVPAWLTIINNQ